MTPKQLKPAEGENPLAAFAGDEVVSPDDYTLLDRSTLENWASCPAMASFVAAGLVNTSSAIANAGNGVHDAVSSAITEWIDQNGECGQRYLKEFLDTELTHSRPDVQPDVIRAARRAVYSWSEFICGNRYDPDKNGIAPENILHYDGGEGERCGQLAYDFDDFQCRVTSEVDFLAAANATPEVLYEIDIKSGHKLVTMDVVGDSFQFQMHSMLVFHKYLECKVLRVSAWNTRTNKRSWAYEFPREHFSAYRNRVHSAASYWYRYRDLPPERCPAWPEKYKCSICDAAHLCPASCSVPQDGESAEDVLDSVVALKAKIKAKTDWLTAQADKRGKDIVSGSACWGRHKPKADKKATATLYEVKE